MSNVGVFAPFTSEGAASTEARLTAGAWIKFKKGEDVIIRVLPPLAEDGLTTPWVLINQHFIKTPSGKSVVFNCPRAMNAGRCPACEEHDRLMSTGLAVDEQLARDWRPSKRAVARAIDRENPDYGVRFVGLSATVLKAMNAIRVGDKLNGPLDFTHPEDGYDLVVRYLGESPWYKVNAAREPSPLALTSDGMTETIERARALDLRNEARVLDYSVIQRKLAEGNEGHAPPPGGYLDVGSSPALGSVNNSPDAY